MTKKKKDKKIQSPQRGSGLQAGSYGMDSDTEQTISVGGVPMTFRKQEKTTIQPLKLT